VKDNVEKKLPIIINFKGDKRSIGTKDNAAFAGA